MADALVDLKTENNALSVWIIEQDLENLPTVIAALAAKMEHLSNLDYALFDLGLIEKAGFRMERNLGQTPCEEANQHHCDLVQLTAANIQHIVDLIKNRAERERKAEWEVGRLLDEAITSGTIDASRIPGSLLSDLEKKRHRWAGR